MNRDLSLSFLLLFLLALPGVSCSNSKSEVAPSSGAKKDAEDADDTDGATDDAQTDGDAGGDGDFSGCGFKSFTDTATSISFAIGSSTIPYHGSGGVIFSQEYTVKVTGTIGVEGGIGGITTNNNFSIVSADPPSSASKAQEEMQKVIGTRKATPVSASAWEALTKGVWSGITCGAIPVSRIEEQTGDHQTVVTFDPPLPYFVSPKMTKARFDKEFPEARNFTNIKATVVSTTNPKTQAGRVVTGMAWLRPIPGETTITENDGNQVKIDADYAFRLDFDFGDFETTSTLGVNKLSTYYVKDGKYIAVSVETGVSQAPSIHYTH